MAPCRGRDRAGAALAHWPGGAAELAHRGWAAANALPAAYRAQPAQTSRAHRAAGAAARPVSARARAKGAAHRIQSCGWLQRCIPPAGPALPAKGRAPYAAAVPTRQTKTARWSIRRVPSQFPSLYLPQYPTLRACDYNAKNVSAITDAHQYKRARTAIITFYLRCIAQSDTPS